MDQGAMKRPRREQWLNRAEEMLTIAQTMRHPETRAQMERLAADWLQMATREPEPGALGDGSAQPQPGLPLIA